jgi:hypothetical protein
MEDLKPLSRSNPRIENETTSRLECSSACLRTLQEFYRDELPPETFSMYAKILADIPEKPLRQAVSRCMMNWEPEKMRVPLPSELLEFLPNDSEIEREHNNAYYAKQTRDAILDPPSPMTPGPPRFDADGVPLTMMDASKQCYGVMEKICGVEPGTFMDPAKKEAWKKKQAQEDERRQKIRDRVDLAFMMRGAKRRGRYERF